LVRPDIQEQDVGALPGEALGCRVDAWNMSNAKLAGAIGLEQFA
jgi:hypothetical protein